MREELEQAVQTVNAEFGYDRITLTWEGWEATLETRAEVSGNRVTLERYTLPHQLERALAAVRANARNYRNKRNATLARLAANAARR